MMPKASRVMLLEGAAALGDGMTASKATPAYARCPYTLPMPVRRERGRQAALPDAALRGVHFRLTGLAAEGLLKFRHIADDVVDAQLRYGVRVGEDERARSFGTDLVAPAGSVGDEEPLQIGEAVRIRIVERFALAAEIEHQRRKREMNAAVIGRILALGE